MKKVLLIGITDIYGGVGRMMFEFCKNTDKNAVHFDFLFYQDISEEEQKLIKMQGASFYHVPRYSRHPVLFYKSIKKFFNSHQYDIVHLHASTAMLIVYALPIWKSKDTKIIYHSHTSFVKGAANKFLHKIFRQFVIKHTDCRIAVSKAAAQFMYGKQGLSDAIILKNGIDTKKYKFNADTREEVRKELKIQNKFVIGHVGRFTYAKNHPFIINVFEQLRKVCPDAVLFLVGHGECESQIRQMVKEKGLEEDVIFYGISNHVERLLCAMDCFILPSNFEGLPLVALEAQANGLPVLASDNVPQEANASHFYISLSITDSFEIWVRKILSCKDREVERQIGYQDIISNGYDILESTQKLIKIYMEM